MQKTALWVIGCALVAGVGGWSLGHARSETQTSGAATVELEAELRKLKSEVKALRRQQTQPVVLLQPPDDEALPEPTRGETHTEPEPSAERDLPAPEGKPPSVEEAQARVAEDFKRYDEFFASEARDPIWAGETERSVAAELAAPDLAFAQVERFQCASSVCRMHAHVDSEGDLNKFARKFSEQVTRLPQGTFRRVADPAGGLRVEGYFTKPGGRLPPRPSAN